MDVRALVLEACERAGVSQAELARRARTSPSVVSGWVVGRTSPTVASLARVLAAAGLQVRPVLEPLLADLDSRVDEVLQGTVALDASALASVAAKTAGEQRWSVELDDGTFERATGPLTWAFDGATALALHGFAFPQGFPAICVLYDDAARAWLTRGMVIGAGRPRISYWDADCEQVRDHLRDVALGAHGLLLVRPVEQMPPVLLLHAEGLERPVPVLSVDGVESGHPALAEVLGRMRDRARSDRRTGGD